MIDKTTEATTKVPKPRGGARAQFLSIGAFAKTRGVSDTAVRKRVKDGTLSPAMVGRKLNVRKANAILSDSNTKGERITSDLASSRKRRMAAQASILRANVKLLRDSVIERKVFAKFYQSEVDRITAAVMGIAAMPFPDDLAGHPNASFDKLDKTIREVLTKLAEVDDQEPQYAAEDTLPELEEDEGPEKDLDALSASALASYVNDQKTAQIKITDLLDKGLVVRLDVESARMDDAFLQFRGRMLSIPDRLLARRAFSKSALLEALKSALKALQLREDQEEEEHTP